MDGAGGPPPFSYTSLSPASGSISFFFLTSPGPVAFRFLGVCLFPPLRFLQLTFPFSAQTATAELAWLYTFLLSSNNTSNRLGVSSFIHFDTRFDSAAVKPEEPNLIDQQKPRSKRYPQPRTQHTHHIT
jgi:hypothetical protein